MAAPTPGPLTVAEHRARRNRAARIARRLGIVGNVEYRHVYSQTGGAQFCRGNTSEEDLLTVYAEAFERDADPDDFSLEAIATLSAQDGPATPAAAELDLFIRESTGAAELVMDLERQFGGTVPDWVAVFSQQSIRSRSLRPNWSAARWGTGSRGVDREPPNHSMAWHEAAPLQTAGSLAPSTQGEKIDHVSTCR